MDGQSFWSDEGASAVMAVRAVDAIVRNTAADIHPPLYYIALSGWARLAGLSEFALRYFSLMAGVVAIAAVVPLVRRLAPAPARVPAVAATAIAPFLVYYSQEARMYAPVLALTAIAAYCGTRIVQGEGERSLLVGYVVSMAAAIYTQYFAFATFLFLSAAFVLWNLPPWARARRWLLWAGLQVAVLAVYLPWLPTMLAQSATWPAISEPLSLSGYLIDVLRVFAWGLSWDYTATSRSIAFVVTVLAASAYWLVRPWGDKTRFGGRLLRYATLWLYLLTPLVVMLGLSLQRPAYNPKLLIVATPAFFILFGMGIAGFGDALAIGVRAVLRGRSRRLQLAASGLAVLLLLVVTGYFDARSLGAYYFLQKYARDDYRGLARLIEQQDRPDDAIVLTAPGQIEIFDYYYRGDLERFPLPQQRPIDTTDTQRRLEAIALDHSRLWMVRWASDQADPERFIDTWLAGNAYRTYDRWFGNVQLVLYQIAKFDAIGPTAPAGVRFGDGIELMAYSIPTESDQIVFEPGDVVPLTLYWQATDKIGDRFTVFAHLVDDRDVNIWGQRDNEPVGGLKPTTTWQPGVRIADNYGLLVLPGTPPGDYEIEVGLYSSVNGQRLGAKSAAGPIGDRFVIGPIHVRRPETPPNLRPEMTDPTDLRFDGIEVLGYNFSRLGGGPTDRTFVPGAIAHLTLFLEASQPMFADLLLHVVVLRDSVIVQEVRRPPAFGNLPTTQWRPGEPIREQLKLPVEQPGSYRVLVGFEAPNGAIAPAGADAHPHGDLAELLHFEVSR